jgi:hypothetical protein
LEPNGDIMPIRVFAVLDIRKEDARKSLRIEHNPKLNTLREERTTAEE